MTERHRHICSCSSSNRYPSYYALPLLLLSAFSMEHWADYVLFILFLSISLAIGMYHACTGGKQSTLEEFILDNRNLKVIPTTISLVVSFVSAITIIGATAEVYTGGLIAWPGHIVSYTVGVLVTERLIVPWIYPLKLTTPNKFFELRYGTIDVRVCTAVLALMSMAIYMGIATLACSIALETATGFPAVASIPLMLGVCVVYTSLGGMRAVIWTDVFQSVVMVGGILAVVIKGATLITISEAYEILRNESRINFDTFSPDPTVRHTFWGFLIGQAVSITMVHGLYQASVQRYCAVSTLENARKSQLLTIVIYAVVCTLAYLMGIFIFGFYAKTKCDPILSRKISSNELVSLFVRTMFSENKGFSGFFLAALYSGGLSSVSSSLSGAAAVFWEDIVSLKLSDRLSSKQTTILNKIFVVMFGVFSMGVAFMANNYKGPILQINAMLTSVVKGPLFGIFLLSGIKSFKWVHPKGVLMGATSAMCFLMWLMYGSKNLPKQQFMPPMSVANCVPQLNYTAAIPHQLSYLQTVYTISYLWYPPIAVSVTIICGLLSSLLFNRVCSSYRDRSDRLPESYFLNIRDAIRWSKAPIAVDTQTIKVPYGEDYDTAM